jgi:DNA repair exonuclease SbcCD ATPase subunit
VAKERENKKEDEKDRVLEKLRSINYRLRKKLKELNTKVERAIDRTDTKRMLAARKKKKVVDIPHQVQVMDKEIENAEQQLHAYQKEVESLKARCDEGSQVDKMLDTEQSLKDNKQICNDLRKQIKELEKMSKDKGKALERLTEGDDYNYKIRSLIDEIRMWKEKIRHRQEVYVKSDETTQLQAERMSIIEKENQKLMSKIQNLDSKIDLEPAKSNQKSQLKAMESIKKDKEEAREKYEKVKEEYEKDLRQARKEVNELTSQRDSLYTRVKELDQEQRISTLKLREVGRVLKHNQLKPIKPIKNMIVKRSESSSRHSMSKRSSTSNLAGAKSSRKSLNPINKNDKTLNKGGNTQSTQLLNKKQYSKPGDDDSEDEFDKNMPIDYEKFKNQQKQKVPANLGQVKSGKGSKGQFETKTNLK